MPELYSLVITSTPSTPIATWDRCRPPRLSPIGFVTSACWLADSALGKTMPRTAAVTTLNTATAASAHQVERTVRSLCHSEVSTSNRCAAPPP
jgi:hypothetical protein